MQSWKRLVPRKTLDLELTLLSGQCFNWSVAATDRLIGFVPGKELSSPYVVSLKQSSDEVAFMCHNSSDVSSIEEALVDYFQLNVDMQRLYTLWGTTDQRMRVIAESLPGLRVLRQEPVECLFSFICSSNNNIPRITLMLDSLRKAFGEKVCEVEGEDYFAFPTVDTLATTPIDALKQLGLGYRSKYVQATAATLEERGIDWLYAMREKDRKTVQKELTKLSGVGQKVADCVALFSLDQSEVVPVDTHVWDIACRDFDPTLNKTKSLTPKVYEKVGNIFRHHYKERAGWAHSLRFAADLSRFRRRLPKALQDSMAAYDETKAKAKAEKRKGTKKTKGSAAVKEEVKQAEVTDIVASPATAPQTGNVEPSSKRQMVSATSVTTMQEVGEAALPESSAATPPQGTPAQATFSARETEVAATALGSNRRWTRSYIREKNVELEELAAQTGIRIFTQETEASVKLDEAMLRGVLGPMKEPEGLEQEEGGNPMI